VRPAAVGSAIGSIFGLVFVFANSGSLAPALTVVVRVLALAAVVGVIVLAVRHRDRPGPPPPGENPFGRRYRLIVAAEVAAIFGGLALLDGPLDASEAAVGWIALVVGVHFFALAAAWRRPFFRRLGAALVLCGGTALALAAAGASAGAIDFTGGVLSGAVLLGFSVWGVQHDDASGAPGT
jgi:hypothetical protein